ncbi:MAG: single-stranded DNA-binding protein [Bacillus sp. (in: firmicutes)]
MINQVTLVGRLTKDPDLRVTGDGIPVTHVTLAVNRHFKNHDGQFEADFVQCTLWRKTAENTARFCQKGSVIGITGRIQSRHYDNNDGKRIYLTEVVADSVQFLGKKASANASIPVPTPPQRQAVDSNNGAAAPQAVASTQVIASIQTAADTSIQQESQNQITAQPQTASVSAATQVLQGNQSTQVNPVDQGTHGIQTAQTTQASSDQPNSALVAGAVAANQSGHGSAPDAVELPF